MPKNLQADIDWHRARIDFYLQAMREVAEGSAPDKDVCLQGLRTIISDLRRTLADLEKVLAQRT